MPVVGIFQQLPLKAVDCICLWGAGLVPAFADIYPDSCLRERQGEIELTEEIGFVSVNDCGSLRSGRP